MSKQSLLLVDGDTRSLRVLEVSLRKAGFSVTPAVSVTDALDKLEVNAPDLIISETKFASDLDGFELRRRLRSTPGWGDIPFIFLTAETAIENKIRGLELGVDDYLTKPIYIKEIVTRINILLQKRQRQFLDLKKDGTRFAGRVTDMPVVDVIQTIEVSRKSGVIQFSNGPARTATIYFRDGKVIDAEAGTLQGEDAVYRLLTWNEGEFEVEFRTVRRRETIATSSQGLLMEGMRRLDEWSRLLEQLPPLAHRFEIDAAELASRLGEIPDDNNRILRLFDGKRTLLEVIDGSDFGDLECLQAISRLYFEGLLIDLDPGVRSRRDTGKSGPHLLVESPPVTPIEEVVSGPIDVSVLSDRLAQADARAPTDSADLVPRLSAEQIDEHNIVSEEEIRGPLSGGYRPSSLRLIDEAVAAAQAIEPSLFEAAELEALGLDLKVPGLDPPDADKKPEPLARVALQKRPQDPRIEAARALVEKTPGVTSDRPGTNGEPRAKPRSSPPPSLPSLRPPAPRATDADAKSDARRETPGTADAKRAEMATPEGARDAKHVETAPDAAKPEGKRPELEAAMLARPAVEAKPGLLARQEPLGKEPLAKEPPGKEPLARQEPGKAPHARQEPPGKEPLARQEPPGKEPLARQEPGKEPHAKQEPLGKEPPAKQKQEPFGKAESKPEAGSPRSSEPGARPGDALGARPGDATDARPGDAPGARPGDAPAPAVIARFEPAEDSSGVPTAIEPDAGHEESTDPSRRRFAVRREDSQGLRMIGSHGRDRAEASGEVRAPNVQPTPPADATEPQRELVTILPRRITREIKAQVPPEGDEAPALQEKTAEPARPVEAPPPRRVVIAGGVSKQPPGRLAQLALAAAAILVCITTYTVCKQARKPRHPVATVPADAAVVATEADAALAPDAAEPDAFVAMAPADAARPDAAVVAVATDAAPRPDATAIAHHADASVALADATTRVATEVDAGTDKSKEAKTLYDKGHAALEDGDPDLALDLLEQSLKLKRSATTYLERARALQRLNRIDEAIASADEAIALSKSLASAYELKGMILWSAQRHAEARPVLEKYLELKPDGPHADRIKGMLEEQK